MIRKARAAWRGTGRVIEEGRHAELVAKRGAYARLHAVTMGAD